MSEKLSLTRDSTMAVTLKIGKELLGNEKLGDTRLVTSQKKKARKTLKKRSTFNQTLDEAKVLLESDPKLANMSGERILRKRDPHSFNNSTPKKRKSASKDGPPAKKSKKPEVVQ